MTIVITAKHTDAVVEAYTKGPRLVQVPAHQTKAQTAVDHLIQLVLRHMGLVSNITF